jgi:hypothetical protein
MAGLPLSLKIAIWFVGALWLVGGVAYQFGYTANLVWFALILGTGTAVAEWRMFRDRQND